MKLHKVKLPLRISIGMEGSCSYRVWLEVRETVREVVMDAIWYELSMPIRESGIIHLRSRQI
jgi:hypothetical protein